MMPADVRSLARSYTQMSVTALAGIIQHSENDSARVAAIGMMLDRGWGRAPGADSDAAGELNVTIRTIVQVAGQVTSEPRRLVDVTPGDGE